MRTSAPRAFASSSEPRPPGTRSMSPKVASVTSGVLGERDRVVDAAHRDHADRAARPVHELDLGREQVLEPVAVDRVRVPAADLHDPHRSPGSTSDAISAASPRASSAERYSSTYFTLHPLEREARMAEQHVARRRLGDEVDRDALLLVSREHDRLGAVDRDDEASTASSEQVMQRSGVSHRSLPQLVELALQLGAALEQLERLARLVLVDPGEREADVDQHPVADSTARRLVDERDADLAADARDVDLARGPASRSTTSTTAGNA